MDWGNASLLELLWTAMAGLALLLWLGGIATALRDATALRGRPNYQPGGVRAQIVRGRLWTAILDAIVQLGLLLLGISAMVTPPALRTINQEQATRGGVLLILIECVLLARAVVTLIQRLRTNGLLRRTRSAKEQ